LKKGVTERERLSAARRERLRQRAVGLAAMREFFAARDFLEIDPPLLVRAPSLEVHIAAVSVAGDRWLISSPEMQMKRLLAGGLERIFAICKCFRAEEEGAHHSTEFTMVEWYRAAEGIEAIRADTEGLVAAVARAVSGRPELFVAGRAIDVTAPWERMTVREAFRAFAGVELAGDEPADELRARLLAAGVDVGTAVAWDDLFYKAFLDRVDPALARHQRPVIVDEWPVRLAALARAKPEDPAVVERFEVYIGGVELANAFGELTCAVEQRRRFEQDQAERARRGRPVPPIDEAFMAALEQGLPPCAGIALGVDRLIMLATGADRIRDVLSFDSSELW
jgi:lysyl-tRNA synthetase class 2